MCTHSKRDVSAADLSTRRSAHVALRTTELVLVILLVTLPAAADETARPTLWNGNHLLPKQVMSRLESIWLLFRERVGSAAFSADGKLLVTTEANSGRV